jgi:hypothetical protein
MKIFRPTTKSDTDATTLRTEIVQGGHSRSLLHDSTHRAAALCIAGALVVVAATTWSNTHAGATGILPPNDPATNIAPSSSDYLTSIDTGRSDEGVAPMDVTESTVAALPVPEQLFIVLNDERIDRGLAPIAYMTAQLDAYAQSAANSGTDPNFPSDLTGGSAVTGGGSIWGGGSSSVFLMDFYWMYSDGWGTAAAPTSNVDCTSPGAAGCWGHRNIILQSFSTCNGAAPVLSMGAAYSTSGYASGSMAAELVSSCAVPSDVTMSWAQLTGSPAAIASVSGTNVIDTSVMPNDAGYWEVQPDGNVAAFGKAVNYGSMSGQSLNAPIVGIASTSDGLGYWLVASDGGIFTFGDARYFGSTGALRLNKPIVGIAATSNGAGYWMVASDGGIFTFGDARFLGSTGSINLNKPIVGMALDPGSGGYWLVASDGGIFSFDAPFYGSTGATPLNKPIVGMESTGNGAGYRFVASDGGVFCFGVAGFDGSMGAQALSAPIVAMVNDTATDGYWLTQQNGTTSTFASAAS